MERSFVIDRLKAANVSFAGNASTANLIKLANEKGVALDPAPPSPPQVPADESNQPPAQDATVIPGVESETSGPPPGPLEPITDYLLEKESEPIGDESLIREKVRAGLTREQAIEVIERQREFDRDAKA